MRCWPPGNGAAAATRTLPRDIASFTGRAAELAQLAGAVTGAAAAGVGVVGIHAIGGMAGVGKTAFAVHAAHRLAGSFPDGQFFLPLHAHTPGQRPVDPADGLASLLLTAGVGAQQIPPGLAARAGRWRDYLAGKKVLLLLDDAASHEQVTPLLPGTGGSVVLVTSRRHLTALEDAAAISLDTLVPAEAAALLARLAGRPGLGSAGRAGRRDHPAVRVPAAGDRDAGPPAAPPPGVECGRSGGRVGRGGGPAGADARGESVGGGRVRPVLPGPDPGPAAAVPPPGRAPRRRHRRLRRGRAGRHRLGRRPPPAGRPVRPVPADRAGPGPVPAARPAARARPRAGRRRRPGGRRRRSRAAAGLLRAHRRGGRPAHRHPAHPRRPGAARRTAGRRPAAIHRRAGVGLAGRRTGEPARGGRVRRRERAARACHRHPRRDQRLPVRPGSLGPVCRPARGRPGHRAAGRGPGRAGRCPQRAGPPAAGDRGPSGRAAASHQQALELYRDLGDRLGQASALDNLGRVQRETGEYTAAAASHQQALALYRDLGHRAGQALAITNLGTVQARTGDYPAAAASHQQALGIFRDIGHRLGQALAISNLGRVQRGPGTTRPPPPATSRRSGMYRDLGDRLGQASPSTTWAGCSG